MSCDRHFANYLQSLEALAVAVDAMKQMDNPDSVIKKAVYDQSLHVADQKAELHRCADCRKQYESSKL